MWLISYYWTKSITFTYRNIIIVHKHLHGEWWLYILHHIVTLHCSLFYWIQPVQPEIFIFSRMNTYDIFVGRRRIRVGSWINFRAHRAANNFRLLEAFVYYNMSIVAVFLLAVLRRLNIAHQSPKYLIFIVVRLLLV